MKQAIALATGFAAGYVVGTRDGREKYARIQQGARRVGEVLAIAEVRDNLRERVSTTSHAVAGKLADANGTKGDDDPVVVAGPHTNGSVGGSVGGAL
jgi:hypothetical protein